MLYVTFLSKMQCFLCSYSDEKENWNQVWKAVQQKPQSYTTFFKQLSVEGWKAIT